MDTRTLWLVVVVLVGAGGAAPAADSAAASSAVAGQEKLENLIEDFLEKIYDVLENERGREEKKKMEEISRREKTREDIYEQMQGDQPSDNENTVNNDLNGYNGNHSGRGANMTDVEYLRTVRNRTKDFWIQRLKQNILQQIGRGNMTSDAQTTTIVTSDDVKANYPLNLTAIFPAFLNSSSTQAVFHQHFSHQVTEKIRSYYPSCEPPATQEIQQDQPAGGGSPKKSADDNVMNLYFDFNPDEVIASGATSVKQSSVAAATLRLYRLMENSTFSSAKLGGAAPAGCDNSGSSPGSLEDERLLRVSIYWYSKSLRKKRVKRRLSDSKVISESSRWVDLNVRPATKAWSKSGRNLGLAVVVEDQEGNALKAERCFKGASCTVGTSTPRPIPTIIIDAARRKSLDRSRTAGVRGDDGAAAISGDVPLPPTIDICTLEFPDNFDGDVASFDQNACASLRIHSSRELSELRDFVNNANIANNNNNNNNNKKSLPARHIRHQRQHMAEFDPRSQIINKRVLTNEELQSLNLNFTTKVDR